MGCLPIFLATSPPFFLPTPFHLILEPHTQLVSIVQRGCVGFVFLYELLLISHKRRGKEECVCGMAAAINKTCHHLWLLCQGYSKPALQHTLLRSYYCSLHMHEARTYQGGCHLGERALGSPLDLCPACAASYRLYGLSNLKPVSFLNLLPLGCNTVWSELLARFKSITLF